MGREALIIGSALPIRPLLLVVSPFILSSLAVQEKAYRNDLVAIAESEDHSKVNLGIKPLIYFLDGLVPGCALASSPPFGTGPRRKDRKVL